MDKSMGHHIIRAGHQVWHKWSDHAFSSKVIIVNEMVIKQCQDSISSCYKATWKQYLKHWHWRNIESLVETITMQRSTNLVVNGNIEPQANDESIEDNT